MRSVVTCNIAVRWKKAPALIVVSVLRDVIVISWRDVLDANFTDTFNTQWHPLTRK